MVCKYSAASPRTRMTTWIRTVRSQGYPGLPSAALL